MYYSDKPINNIQEDILGREVFVRNLAETINNYDNDYGMVIGVFGEWGTGKTSILNMVLDEINNTSTEENKPIMVKFTPWGYPSDDKLIASFFRCFNNAISKNAELKNEIGETLNNYSFLFDALKFVPYLGDASASIAKGVSNRIVDELKISNSIEENREKIEKAIIKQNKKIIITIDDIDRLTQNQIRDVFQLVKQVANFSKVIYLLAMDRKIVTDALKEVHGFDGEKYLEKIVQVPFEIPQLNSFVVEDYFVNELMKILNTKGIQYAIDQQYWNSIFLFCIRPYIKTIRDANRVLNVFRFKYNFMFYETNIDDLVAITIIEVVEPKLYKWIFENKNRLCGGYSYFKNREVRNNEKETDRIKKEFEELGLDAQVAYECIRVLFPNMLTLKEGNDSISTKKMRISNSNRFDLFFQMNMSDIPVSRGLINDCINIFTEEGIVETIKEIFERGNIVYFFVELKPLAEGIPDERKEIVVRALYNTQAYINKPQNTFFSPSLYAIEIAREILYTLEDGERCFKLFAEILKKGDLSEIGAVSQELVLIKGDYKNDENDRTKILSEKQIVDLEKVFCDNIVKYSEKEGFISSKDIDYILSIWERADENGYRLYIEKLTRDKIMCIKYACAVSICRIGSAGIKWGFNTTNKACEFITKEKIKDIIDQYNKKDLFKDYTEEELIKIASFELNYDKKEEYYVSEETAKVLVNDWRKKEEL